MKLATAVAHPNIALIKYWGKRDVALNLPAVPSLSLTVDGFHTRTTVAWGAPADRVQLDGRPASADAARRVLAFLDRLDPARPPVEVRSENDFPTGAGLASSASAFAALALAASRAAGQERDRTELSILARQGSGSACRSLWGGFVVWDRGERADGRDSHARPLAPADHWNLRLVVAVVSGQEKAIGSTEGMIRTQRTSPLFPAFVQAAPERLQRAIEAVQHRDLAALGEQMERSTWEMHATMISAWPSVRYWVEGSLACLRAVEELRAQGVGAWSTMDAGPNVKVLCAADDAPRVAAALRALVERVEILSPGGEPRVADGEALSPLPPPPSGRP